MNGYGIYEGEFKNNKMNGLGLFKWNDGRKFFGLFENDIRNGFGIYFWKDSLKIYDGFWENRKQNGFSKLKNSDKKIIVLEIYVFGINLKIII